MAGACKMKRMDPVDVISISDTESSASSIVLVKGPLMELEKIPNPEYREEVLTLSSVSRKSTERCPVTWTEFAKQPNLSFLNQETFTSPSPRSKVTHWLSENVNNRHTNFQLNRQQVFVQPQVAKNSPIDSLNSFSTNKSSILVRQDYKKSSLPEIKYSGDNCVVDNINTGKNNIIYVEHTNESDSEVFSVIKPNLVQKSTNMQCDLEQSEVDIDGIPRSTPMSVKSLVENMPGLEKLQTSTEQNDGLKDTRKLKTCTNIPLSPETQKKIELCQYLKLMNMNPADTRTSRMTQNRRSNRVKHLALMSEKRQLERKLNSETQSEPEKKKNTKISDADSRHSSDNDRGSKTSKRSSALTVSSKTSSEHTSPTQKNPLEVNKQKNRPKSTEWRTSIKTPSKSLQVPEVSTTSILKYKNTEFNKFIQANKDLQLGENNLSSVSVALRKSDSNINYPEDNRINNSTITRKSFEQLHMDVKNLKPLRSMRSQSIDSRNICTDPDKIRFSLVKSVANIPNIHCDFDDIIKIILNQEIAKVISPMHANNHEDARSDVKDEIPVLPTRKRKEKASENNSKSKVPKLNGKYKKSKYKKPKTNTKVYIKRNINNKKYKLRSRGRLKQLQLKKILQQNTKKRKLRFQRNFLQQKDFKSAELIQHGCGNNSNTTKELINTPAPPTQPPLLSPTKTPPTNIRKSLPNVEVWKKYFTSEHRKAYIESIRYLEEGENSKKTPTTNKTTVKVPTPSPEIKDSPPCYGFNTTEIRTDEIHKLQVTCKNIKSSIIPKPYVNTISGNGVYPERNRPSMEDLEVDELMSRKRMKDQATQKGCESLDVDLDLGRESLPSDLTLADNSRCSSSTDPSSTNSWSLQTVESNQGASTSTARQNMIEVPCNDGIEHQKSILNIKSATPLNHDDSSSHISVCQPEVVNISQIQPATCTYVPLPSNGTEVKSLHHCLTQTKVKLRDKSRNNSPINQQDWEESLGIDKSSKTERKTSQSHTIYLSNTNGAVMSAYYLDYNIIIVQELMVSFWNQSPLGHVLGAQDMWIPKGNTRRMVLGNGCVHKESSETVISFDNTVAYIELWTKEHKSDKRERPVADIFIAIYLRLSRNGPDKKVLQLENIHGYASDVQYIVLRNARSIIVSWSVTADTVSSTLVHCYHLSPDYQTVTSITKMQTVDHYVSSLHNIEDCDTLILGCGDYKITLWDLEHSYVVSTIDLIETHPQPRTVWAKRDRGFLFTLHHFSDGVLQLIAINSFDSTWKRLQTYKSELDYENLLGVCMENGLLVAFYDTGVSCWSAQTGTPVLEDTTEDSGVLLPYGKHVVVVLNNQVHVRHALEYLITICPIEES